MGLKGLENRTVVVTGGAAGIGLATARRFAAEGARVAIWDITEAAGRAAEEGISEGGGQALFSRVDVTDASSVERGFEEVIERFGSLSVLVNNAGILRDAQLVKWKDGAVTGRMEERDFDAVISVNLKGVFLCTRAAAPHLIRGGGGAILNATSVVGLYGNFGQTNYVASKAGVIGMTRTWAREAASGSVQTQMEATVGVSDEQLRLMVETHLYGTFYFMRAALRQMTAQGGGAIVTIGSRCGQEGCMMLPHYSAAKGAQHALTRAVAQEVAEHGIRVNAVAPGFIATEMVKAMPEKVIGLMIQRTPLGRMGTPEEVASAYAWLASDEAGFVTGAVLSVDGGVVVGT